MRKISVLARTYTEELSEGLGCCALSKYTYGILDNRERVESGWSLSCALSTRKAQPTMLLHLLFARFANASTKRK